MTRLRLHSGFNLFRVAFLAVFSLALLGCGGGGGGSPAGINPTGYYQTGTASVSDGGNSTIDIADLQAIVNGNRIMMMSVAQGLLYDGTITDIADNTFTADFTIYADGIANAETASVSGTISQGSKIEGTLTGSGVGSGTFSLTYAMRNGQADISRIANTESNPTWGAKVGGSTTEYEIVIIATDNMYSEGNDVDGEFYACEIFGSTISGVGGTNIYKVNTSFRNCQTAADDEENYTGLATTQTSADAALVYMMTNGAYSFSGDFK